ncbi:MAG: hypothetical protein CMP49_03940 [Flavobacteriales bacterium]|nr:hypothetical protein [Flavobacteriales bacterium]|tara:strand:+ start:5043 stop:5912 length:870 start_codon:yes stop_codon:yes gene_type:complete
MIFIINNNIKKFFFLIISFILGFSSCKEYGCTDASAINFNLNATEDDGSCNYNECLETDTDCLEINFHHFVDDLEIIFGNDNINYQNNAGNHYSVRRILYVLSEIMLFFEDGTTLLLDEFFFINTDDPQTLTKTLYNLPALSSGISFTLGFRTKNNIDNQYINVENNFHSLMLWPNTNGVNLAFQGGYHYMKLEGKYLDELGQEKFYNHHTGPTNGSDFSFYQFIFNYSGSDGFNGVSNSISINMNVNNFYNDPVYDFNIFGSGIMDNIDAQWNLFQNAGDVFYVATNY